MQPRNQGRAADLPLERRPGVPRQQNHQPVSRAVKAEITPQPQTVLSFKHPGRDAPTPVFGTAAPPRGLSGLLRKTAYGIPEHRARHFLLLMAADRVDVLEHSRLPSVPFAAAAALGTGMFIRRLRRGR